MCKISRVLVIRNELASDAPAVRGVNIAAFERDAEADLVDLLRQRASPIISLVAEMQGSICGHILFTPASLAGEPDVSLMALAPLAVRPEQQRRGVGSALVRAGLAACAERRCHAVIVLGHSAYYPRFGFQPASRLGLSCEFHVPDDAFMVKEMKAGALAGRAGTIRYHELFAGA
jgi:putative acetyltransferase